MTFYLTSSVASWSRETQALFAPQAWAASAASYIPSTHDHMF